MAKKARKQAPKRAQKPMSPATFSEADVKLTQDVKRANQRLRELEKQGMENSPAYQAAERLALIGDKAMSVTGKGQIKFNTNIRSLNYNQRRHLEAEVKRFLEAESSTTKGYKKIAERAKEAYEKAARKEAKGEPQGGKNYNEWMDIWKEAITKQYVLLYGSEETFNLIIKLYDSPLDYDGAVNFMQSHFGEPLVTIFDAVPHDEMDKGTTEPWDWGDIFEPADNYNPPF